MQAYVITIMDMPESRRVAQRCIESGAAFGAWIETHPATTPADSPHDMFIARAWSSVGFDHNAFSRLHPCMATFISHSSLWQLCVDVDEPILIMEHDAVIKAPIPELEPGYLVCNLGRPSFGHFETPPDGIGPLSSKRYFPGAHGYAIEPTGAAKLLAKAATDAQPTDVYLGLSRFPWLLEYHPWPIVCDDSFSTIQRERGCIAKHNKVVPL